MEKIMRNEKVYEKKWKLFDYGFDMYFYIDANLNIYDVSYIV